MRIIFLCTLATVACCGAAPSTSPSSRPAPATSAPSSVAFILERPPGENVADNAAYERWLMVEAARLVNAATASQPSSASHATAIKAARFLLDRRCEPALSRVLLGIAEPGDAPLLQRAASQAVEFLHPTPASPPADAAASRPASGETERLDAIAQALAALGVAGDPTRRSRERVREALLDASRAQAAYLDDPRSDVAALARLLQGACYRRAGRADRAVQVLGTAGRPGTVLPFELFARLEHCRALADQGYPVPALALALRLEARCTAWIPMASRTAAAHSFRALRIFLLEAWARRPSPSSAASTVAPADAHDLLRQSAKLKQSFGGGGPVALYRLGHILPEEAR